MSKTTYFKDCTYVVISRGDGTTFGPFPSEESAIEWAKTLHWHQGWYTRAVHPPTPHTDT